MPLIQRCSNRMANEMLWMQTCPHAGVDHEIAAILVKRGWIVRKEPLGTIWTYALTQTGKVAFERWKKNRKDNIKHWSRIGQLFYDADDCSARAEVHIGDDVMDLEPEVVKEMIDDGLLEYENATDSWVAPRSPHTARFRERGEPVLAGGG